MRRRRSKLRHSLAENMRGTKLLGVIQNFHISDPIKYIFSPKLYSSRDHLAVIFRRIYQNVVED